MDFYTAIQDIDKRWQAINLQEGDITQKIQALRLQQEAFSQGAQAIDQQEKDLNKMAQDIDLLQKSLDQTEQGFNTIGQDIKQLQQAVKESKVLAILVDKEGGLYASSSNNKAPKPLKEGGKHTRLAYHEKLKGRKFELTREG